MPNYYHCDEHIKTNKQYVMHDNKPIRQYYVAVLNNKVLIKNRSAAVETQLADRAVINFAVHDTNP